MSHTISKGIYSATVPDLNDQANIPADMTALASDVLTGINGLDASIQGGSATVQFANATTGTVQVTFPKAYAATPAICVTPRNNTVFGSVTGATATGFTLNLTRANPSSNAYTAFWIAIPTG